MCVVLVKDQFLTFLTKILQKKYIHTIHIRKKEHVMSNNAIFVFLLYTISNSNAFLKEQRVM